MSLLKTGTLPGLEDPTEAQQRKIQMLCGTFVGYIEDAKCSDLEAKAIVTNLRRKYGSLEEHSEAKQQALKANYKKKRYIKPPKWLVT